MTRESLLLFGGTFDPIHNGHLIIARAVAEKLEAARIVLVPSAHPPHKDSRRITPPEHRFAMTEAAVAGDDLFAVSDCELKRDGPSYTLETVQAFRQILGDTTQLYWLIGGDTIHELTSWYQAGELADACTIVTAVRPGYEYGDLSRLKGTFSEEQIRRLRDHILETPEIDISSTDIRRRVKVGLSIRYLTPEKVADYISNKKLYVYTASD